MVLWSLGQVIAGEIGVGDADELEELVDGPTETAVVVDKVTVVETVVAVTVELMVRTAFTCTDRVKVYHIVSFNMVNLQKCNSSPLTVGSVVTVEVVVAGVTGKQEHALDSWATNAGSVVLAAISLSSRTRI